MNNIVKIRIIAIIVTVCLLIVSLAYGKLNSYENSKEESDLNGVVSKAILKESGITSAVEIVNVKDGNNSESIQKISVNSEINSAMINEYNSNSIINQIKSAQKNNAVKAILLSINTPGGGVYESYELYRALKESGKDVYVSMKQQATSGGYYISMPAKKIFATNEETITGSIGVIMSYVSFQKFMEDHGIKYERVASGDQKAVVNNYMNMPEDTKKIYQELNKESYERFVDVVASGRNIEKEKVKKLADGRIYSAKQALDNGLIDKIGTENELIETIASEKGLDNPKVFEIREVSASNSLFGRFIDNLTKAFADSLDSAVKDSATPQRSYNVE